MTPVLDPASSICRGAVGRADLLLLLTSLDRAAAAEAASLLGYGHEPRKPEPPAPTQGLTPQPPPPPLLPPVAERPVLRARQFAATHREQRVAPPDDSSLPANQDSASVLESVVSRGDRPPSSVALSPTRRIADLLHRQLRPARETQGLDVHGLIADLVRVRVPRRLPRLQRKRWSADAALIIDLGLESVPLHEDLIALAETAHRLSAGTLPIYWRQPSGQWTRRVTGTEVDWCPARECDALKARHWLLAGDLGSQGGEASLRQWRRRLHTHAAAGGSTIALLGAVPAPWRTPLPQRTGLIVWDHGRTLVARPNASIGLPADNLAVQKLLAALSMAVRIEPFLLRAVRLALDLSMAAELAAWNHPDVERFSNGMRLAPDRLAFHRSQLCAMPLAQRQRIAGVIRQQHLGVSPLVVMEEAVLAAELAELDCEQARSSWANAVRTLEQAPNSQVARQLESYLARTAARVDGQIWCAVPELAEAYTLAHRDALEAGAAVPEGMPAAILARRLGTHDSRSGDGPLWIAQSGSKLKALPVTPGARRFPLLEFGPTTGFDFQIGTGPRRWLPWRGVEEEVADLHGKAGPWTLRTGTETLVVAEIPRPSWAIEWGRDGRGLYATHPAPDGTLVRLYWQVPATAGAFDDIAQGIGFSAALVNVNDYLRVGADLEHGLWCEIEVRGVTQRFRWIEPGKFLMGSPPDEPERSGDEGPQHEVTLSKGFWLADTACTQALWQAVTGSNPSHFQGDPNQPVEQISWNDVQTFLQQLESALPGMKATLPTEAEWEYACRAGTTTPFSFGDQITPEQVIYHGKYPYNDSNKNEYREWTLPVKSLPSNAWGLYEMHGNVWEWCADDRGKYDGQPQQDPFGPDDPDTLRALRGGSWNFYASYARSARRRASVPDIADINVGFRLSLKSTQPGPAVTGRPGLLRPEGDPEDAAPDHSGTRRSGAPPSVNKAARKASPKKPPTKKK